MARLRLVFALLALAILAATALLARRALRAGEVERSARHETLAERLYDEMEGALSGFLRREEERPIGQYGFSSLAEGGGRVRSPLSRLADDPDAPFVVGWFQLDPDGRVRSPLVPAADEPASGAPPEPRARETAARVQSIVERALATKRGAVLADADAGARRDARAHEAPAPVVAKQPVDMTQKKDAEKAAAAQEEKPAAPTKEEKPEARAQTTYDVLQSLNRAADERQKGRKLLEADAPGAEGEVAIAEARPPEPSAAGRAALAKSVAPSAAPEWDDARRAEAPAQGAPPMAEAPLPEPAPAGATALAGDDRAAARPSAAPPSGARAGSPPAREPASTAPAPPAKPKMQAPAAPRETRVRIAVDPFVGLLAGDDLILVRTVLVGERGFRQGVVLDVVRLAEWLRARALDRAMLPGAELRFEPGGSFRVGTLGPRPFRSAHPFAEPFDALRVELALEPLPDGPGEQAVLALAALLVLAAGGGLFALYRMVAVRLAFAQRRSNFAAAVSHELKTPLTAIRMYVEMLRDGLVPSEEKRREYYATLGAESERLSRLIDNVLEFSRLERGTRTLDARAAPLGPAVEDVVALLRPHAERQGFRLETAIDAALPPVRFERDALAQILFNLVENALKYARGASERSVVVACRGEPGAAVLSVRDRGPGVPERRLARVFEPFYRGEDELTRETQGSGIGLALVRGLAERMGADVAARNVQGGGLEVTLRFPAAPAGA